MRYKLIKLLNLIIIGNVLVGFTGCKSDPKPQDVVLLTYNVPSYTDTSTSDDWLYISDQAGNILDVKSFEAGQTISLKSSKVLAADKINITFLSRSVTGIFNISSYLAFPVGQTWKYTPVGYFGNTQRTLLGTIKVIVNNFTSQVGEFVASDTYGGVTSSNALASNTLTSNIDVFPNTSKIFISSFKNSVPVYYELNNPTPGNTYTLNLATDFKTFDHTFNFDLTGSTSCVVRVYASNDSQVGFADALYGYSTGGIRSFGYNDGFATYYTSIEAFYVTTGTYPAIEKDYFKIGKAVTSTPSLLNYTFDVTNGSIGNFVFSISGSYTTRVSFWHRNISGGGEVNYYVYAPSGIQQILSLPPEIQSKYPSLDFSVNSHQSSTFYLNLDGTTYESKYVQNAGLSKEFQSIEFER